MTLIDFAHPAWLAALPLALLPLRTRRADERVFAWNQWLPPDALGAWRARLEKALAVFAMVALILGLAGVGLPETVVSRMGSGAEIVVLLDRSLSMDEAMLPPDANRSGVERPMVEKYGEPKKRKVARKALAAFAAARPDDVFSLMMFSTVPFSVLPFNVRPDMIQAAIVAGGVGSGLAETDVGRALQAAIERFDDRPYAGSRIIMLVSDGGAQIEPDVREAIAAGLRRNHIALYWIYLRSTDVPPLDQTSATHYEGMAEVAMHHFFQSLSTPYRVFEAQSPDAMKQAIDAVARQQTLPITYRVRVARAERATLCYLLAALACALLLLLRAQHIFNWKPSS